MLLVITGAGTFHHGVVQLEESRSLRYPNCDGALRPVVHEGHDMKLPLFYSSIRMKEFRDLKAGASHEDTCRTIRAPKKVNLTKMMKC